VELFLDNDIILKLASIGLLQKIETIFNVESSSIFILPTAKYYIRNSKNVKDKYSPKIIIDCLDIIKKYSSIPDNYIDEKIIESLSDIPGIDSGEQILFSIRPQTNDFLILTGDKRALTHLWEAQGVELIKLALSGKIVCLEWIMINLLESENFDSLLGQIKASNFCEDQEIRIVFNQVDLTPEMAKKGLQSYLDDLKKHTGNLLY
jgi:hypothetical protein